MAISWETKLIIVNAICQGYFCIFGAITLYVGFCTTLPEYSAGDEDYLLRLRLLAFFLFVNMIGNYICIRYKARLSAWKSANEGSKSATLYPRKNGSTHSLVNSTHNSLSQSSSSSTYHIDKGVHITWSSANQDDVKKSTKLSDESERNIYPYDRRELNVDNAQVDAKDHSGIGYDNFNGSTSPAQQRIDFEGAMQIQDNEASAENESEEIIGGWKFCKDCQTLAPPRSKHCPLCNACILKHDHHCFFAGCCVGFHNQRYFVLFCMYSGMGGIYSCIIASHYLNQHYEALQSWGVIAYTLPVLLVLWIVGSTEGYVVAMCIFFYWSILNAFVSCYYFAVQVFLVCRGQTKYECLKDIKTYRSTVCRSFISVFGKQWMIGCIIPAPFLTYYGDGVNWDSILSESKFL